MEHRTGVVPAFRTPLQPQRQTFPRHAPTRLCLGFVCLGCMSVHHKTAGEPSRLSPEKWVSAVQTQPWLVGCFSSGAKSVPEMSEKCFVVFQAEGGHTNAGRVVPKYRITRCTSPLPPGLLCHRAGLHRDGTAPSSPGMASLRLVVHPHPIIKNALWASIHSQ